MEYPYFRNEAMIEKVDLVYNRIDDIETVSQNIDSVDNVSKNIDSVSDVSAIKEEVKDVSDNMGAVLGVHANEENINVVKENDASIRLVAGNIDAVLDAPNQAESARLSAQTAEQEADRAERNASIQTYRNIGDIFFTTRLDTELNGAVECNGATYNKNDFTGEQAIGNLLALNKVPYVSFAEYQTAIDTNGSCRAFGWDGGDSFRVPTIPALLLTKEQASVVGNGMTVGLTDGRGSNFGVAYSSSAGLIAQDTMYNKTLPANLVTGNQPAGGVGVTTDPTKSGIVANLDTIQYRAMVQLANEATDNALITATSVVQQVADLSQYKVNTDASNFTAEAKQTIVGWGIPDYSRTTSASKTVGQVQSVLVDSEIRVIQTGSDNDYYMYYNIVPCNSDGTEITGYCLTGSGGYTGATSGGTMLLKAGSYFKVKSWSAMKNNNLIITPLFGG